MQIPRAPRIPTALAAGLLLLLSAPAADAATLEITGPPGATITVGGQTLGFLPLDGPLEIRPGRYEVTAELSGYQPFTRVVSVDSRQEAVVLHVRMQRLSRATAWRSNVLYAGLGHLYVGKKTRGIVYAAVETGGLLTAVVAELQRSNHRKDYLTLRSDYEAAVNADVVTALRAEADAKYAEMEDAESLRNTGLLVAAAAVVVSVADVLLTFPQVAAGPGPIAPATGALDTGPGSAPSSLTSVHAAVKLSF